jgi:methylated-DNA-[protein]-cysteine S-methyltransferase
MSLVRGTQPSPLGMLHFTLHDGALAWLGWADEESLRIAQARRRFGRAPDVDESATRPIAERIARYFEGDLAALDGLAVDTGGTRFQEQVWAALRAIRPGTSCSYADVARAVGAPSAVRAVGAANGRNPVALVVPCHRVIGKDGSLTGYAAGIERKKWLLEHERAHA